MHQISRLLLAGILMGGLCLAVATADDPLGDEARRDDPNSLSVVPDRPFLLSYGNDGCEEGARDYPGCGDDEFEFVVRRDTLFVRHLNAVYNCCPDDILVQFGIDDHVIRLVEREILTHPCMCLCCYTVRSEVTKLAPGAYTVRYHWIDDESHTWELREERIVVPPSGETPHIEVSEHSDCLDQGDGTFWPCEEDDEIRFGVAPNTLRFRHDNASYNCCLDDITFSLTVEGERLFLWEEEVITHPCYCICCFNAGGLVVGLPPGSYVVQFCWNDYETMDVRCYEEVVEIP